MPPLSERVSRMATSATLAVQKKAAELKAQGADLVDFGIGEPDFHTPEPIKRAAERAIRENFTKYTNAGGILELREAVAHKYRRDYGTEYDPIGEVIITCGGKQALFNAALVLFGPGDEVIVPAPYWVSFPQQIALTGARVVTVDASEDRGFTLTAPEVAAALTPRTKAVILNFPNNPSGAIIEERELEQIIEIARERDVYVIYDECYEQFVYDGAPLSASKFGKQHVIVTGSCSKSYAMTGWRIGWAAGPSQVIQAMEKIQSQSTSNPSSIAQKAAVEALTGDQGCIQEMIAAYRERRDVMVRGLNAIPGIRCGEPQGAFYVFPNVSALFSEQIQNATEFAQYALEEAGIVTISGTEFGRAGFLRLSYATSMERIEEGLRRLYRLLKRAR